MPDNDDVLPGPMILAPDDNLVFIDMETFGLDYLNDEPLEVGLAVTDRDLNILEKQSWLVWETEQNWYEDKWASLPELVANGDPGYQYVIDMHAKSGLIVEARESGEPINIVHRRMLDWLEEQGFPMNQSMPMVGSSVNFDRMFAYFNFRKFYEAFHYRVIDVSTLKMLAAIYSPSLGVALKHRVEKMEHHRVLDDIEDTVNELTFYVENFLKTER